MNAALSTAASGLQSAADSFARRATEIARAPALDGLATPGASPSLAGAPAGPEAPPPVADAPSAENDLTRNVVGVIRDEIAFKANAAVARRVDELTGALLDITA